MKKLFAIIMSMLMIACFMPTMAFAGGVNVASVGEIAYTSLQEAIDAAEANAEVKLLANVSLGTSLEIKKDVTLNLDTYNIIAADGFNDDFLISVTGDYKQGCSLTLSGTTGAIIADKGSSLGCVQLQYHGCGFHMIGGNLKNETSYAVQSAPLVPIVENGEATKWESIKNASIIIDGGKIESSDGNGSIGLYGKTNLAVNGGTVESTARTAIYVGNDSTAVIKGENTLIKAKSRTIEARNGASVDIKENAKIQSTNGQVLFAYENAVINLDQADISASGFFGYIYAKDEVKLTVTGNTKISAAERQPFYLADNSVLEISSADISYPAGKDLVYESDNNNVKVSVTGGTFSNDVSKYVPSGMEVVQGEGSKYTIAQKEDAVAKIGNAYYATIKDAVSGANDGDTIELVSDCTETGQVVIPEGKNITLDLGKNKITTLGDQKGFWSSIYGGLTIKGNGYIGDATHESVAYLLNIYGTVYLEGNVTYESGLSVVQMQANEAKLYIKDGYFIGDTYGGKYWTLNKIDKFKDSLIEVSGGTFKNFDPSSGKTESPDENWVKEGYKVEKIARDGYDDYKVVRKSSSSGGGGAAPVQSELDKVKAEANTALFTAVAASKYDDAEQAEVKSILEKAAADIKAAKTEAEVKAIQEAAQAEIDKILTSEEKAEIEAVTGVSSDIFKAKSKLTKLNGKRAIKVTWNVPKEMKLDGYEVFRSTERYSGFGKTPYFTTSKTDYTNNKELKTDKTYYYKVRGFVEINGVKYYTKFSTKAYRTIK